jgi:hypothetical protein
VTHQGGVRVESVYVGSMSTLFASDLTSFVLVFWPVHLLRLRVFFALNLPMCESIYPALCAYMRFRVFNPSLASLHRHSKRWSVALVD